MSSASHHHPAAALPPDDEISLIDLLEILWTKRRWIIGSAAITCLVSIIAVLFMARTYEARTVLLVHTPVEFSSGPLSPQVMESLALSNELIGQLLKEVPQSTSKTPVEIPNYIKRNISVSVSETSSEQRTPFIKAEFRAADASVALSSAQAWTRLLNARLKETYASIEVYRSVETRKKYQELLTQSQTASTKLREYLGAKPLPRLQAELEQLTSYRSSLLQQINSSKLRLQGLPGEIKAVTEALEKETPILMAVDSTAPARETQPRPVLNPLYQRLGQDLVQLNAEKNRLEQQSDWLQKTFDDVDTKVIQLENRVREVNDNTAELQRQASVSLTLAAEAEARHAQTTANTSVETMGNLIRVINSPELPKQAIAPARTRIVILATLSGLFLGILAAFLTHAIDKRRQLRHNL